jgi:hypothetical protein
MGKYCPNCQEELDWDFRVECAEEVTGSGEEILDCILDDKELLVKALDILIGEIDKENYDTMEFRNSLPERRKKFEMSLENPKEWGNKTLLHKDKEEKLAFWDKVGEINSQTFDTKTIFNAKNVIQEYIKFKSSKKYD